MAILRNKKQYLRGNIIFLPTEEIHPSPIQPRKHFNQVGLEELAASIREHGVLQPLTVRMRSGNYELIAGERRLRASRMIGLEEVPCIMLNVNMEQSSIIALVENLQRKDLDVIEEAEGIAQLIRLYGMSQEEAAKRLGKSQSAIANKLRILRLPADVLDTVRDADLSERHARALLRLRKADEQRYALKHIIENSLNVAATESFIDYLLSAPSDSDTITAEAMTTPEIAAQRAKALRNNKTDNSDYTAQSDYSDSLENTSTEAAAPAEDTNPTEDTAGNRKKLFVVKDVRIFLNSLARGLDLMKQGGINIGMDKRETTTDLILTINIPKNKPPKRN